MAEKTISALVEGGKATAGPPLGPSLAPLGIPIPKVIAEINDKTMSFAGMTIPVKVIVNPASKSFVVEVGTPPVSALIKKEIAMEKGSGKPGALKVGDITVDQAIKVSRAKGSVLHGKTPRAALKEVIGSCVSIGVLVEGKDAREAQKLVDSGAFDDKLSGKVALKEPSQKEMDEKKKFFLAKIEEAKKTEEAAKAAEEAAKAAAAAATAPAAGAAAPAGGAPAAAPAGESKKEEPKKEERKK